MRRLTLPLLAVGLTALVLGSTLGLGAWALVGAQRAEAARHREVAFRLFDAMEAELSDLVAAEEARSFLEYRAYYVPARSAKLGSVARSPLADGAVHPAVLGYFQQDPDGTISSPEALRDNELGLAAQEGWAPPVEAEDKLTALREVLADVEWGPLAGVATRGVPGPVPRPVGSKVDVLNSLGSASRQDRVARNEKLGSANLQVYQSDRPVQQQVVQLPGAASDHDFDVSVSPLRGQRVDGRLVLAREVRIEGDVTRQGFVVDPERLADWLDQRVVMAAGLSQEVTLTWDGSEPDGAYVFDHRFAPPFEALAVRAGLQTISGVRGYEQGLLQVLGLGLLGLLVLVGGALTWAVRAELEYARRRQDFVAAVSHELKTPLTSIRMYAEMLRDGMVPSADRQHTYHATITTEAERLSRLIDNVLELSRVEQGRARPAPVVGPVGPVIDDALAMLRPHAAAVGVELVVDVASGLPPVAIDRDGLIQVLVNLVDNAVKFGGQGTVRLRVAPEGGGAVLVVRDEGPGVPRAQLRRIFEPFFRGERELTRTTRGTGIGLALVRTLVEEMGGRVSAANHPEGGLEVRVHLVGAAGG